MKVAEFTNNMINMVQNFLKSECLQRQRETLYHFQNVLTGKKGQSNKTSLRLLVFIFVYNKLVIVLPGFTFLFHIAFVTKHYSVCH